jgi:hypothetical protein
MKVFCITFDGGHEIDVACDTIEEATKYARVKEYSEILAINEITSDLHLLLGKQEPVKRLTIVTAFDRPDDSAIYLDGEFQVSGRLFDVRELRGYVADGTYQVEFRVEKVPVGHWPDTI